MFFYISKLLKFIIFPFTWVVALFVLAYFVKNKKWRRGWFIAALVVLLVFSCKPLLQTFQYLTTKSYSHQQLPKKYYKVAVVMGGYGHMNLQTGQMSYIDDRGERLWEPIRLYHSGIVEKILISGDASIAIDKDSGSDSNSTVETFMHFMKGLGIYEHDIILEQKARNTTENATFSIALLDSLHYKPEECLLVTSATHMKRSLACFANEGWHVDGYAVNIYTKPQVKPHSFIPSWKTLTDWNELLNEWVGGIVYKISGK